MRRRSRRQNKAPAELDITAFMNLMVILVPFLLITAVFSQVNILEMNLPTEASSQESPPKPPEFQLEVILRTDGIYVNDRPGRRLKSFPIQDEQYDLKGLTELLQQLKSLFPDEQTVSVLLDPDVSYDQLIQVMDSVRSVEVKQGEEMVQAELFPDIALGDAPLRAKAPGKVK